MYVLFMTAAAQFLLRFRWLVLLATLAWVGFSAVGLSRLSLSADLEVFFAPDDPELAAYDAVRNTYSRDDNLFLVLVPDGPTVFSAAMLAVLEELTDRAWAVPHSTRVDSIANYQHTAADGDDLSVRPLVENALSMSPEQVALAERVATTEPLLLGRLITPSGHMAAINISIHLPAGQRQTAIPEAVEAVRALRDEFEAKYPGIEVLLTGKIAGNNAFTEASIYDLSHIVPLALLVALGCILVFLCLVSGSPVVGLGATLATILVILCSVIVGMGTAGWLGFEVTPPLVNAPTVILTLAVADCLHILVNTFQARRRGLDREAAIVASLRLNFRAVLLTSLTTIIGFLALNFSESPPFNDLGNVSAIGVAAAWVFSITLLPVVMSFMPGVVPVQPNAGQGPLVRMADLVLSRPRLVSGLAVFLILSAMAFLPRNELYDVWAEYFDESTEIRQDSDRARLHLNGFNTLEFSLGAGAAGGITDPAYLTQLGEFADWLRAQPEVSYVNHFGQIMQRLNRNMHGDDPAWYRVPDDSALAAQYLLLYEFSLPFGLDLTNQVNLDKSATRLTLGLNSSSTKDVLALQSRAQAWLREQAPPSFYHGGASSDSMYAHVGQRNVVGMLIGSALGLLAISLIIAIALRSPRFGLLSLLLNALPMLVGFGLWGLLVGRIGMGLSVVSGLTMGIVVDYTVHLLSKYQLARSEQGLNTAEAIRYAFSTVGAALVLTTAVLVVNFGLLAFSVFVLNAELGILTAGIILIALAIDFLLLPPLLLLLDRPKAGA